MLYPLQISVNSYSEVVLTKTGAEVLNNYFKQYHLHTDEKGKKQDEEWFPTDYKEGDKFQSELHHIMSIFGESLIPGLDVPFVSGIVTILQEPK